MKKASFTGLLYREFYLSRTDCITQLLSLLLFIVFGWMMFLSMKSGNLIYLTGGLSGESEKILISREIADVLRGFVLLYMKLLPSGVAGMIAFLPANMAAKDLLNSWNRFEHCCPVTPLRYAAVKTIVSLIASGAAFLIAWIHLFTMTCAMGEPFTYRELSVIVFLCSLFTIFQVLSQIMITLLKNRDMGFLSATGMLCVPIFLIAFLNVGSGKETTGLTEVQNSAEVAEKIWKMMEPIQKYSPCFWILLVVSFVILFVSVYLLYQRREK